MERIDGEKRAQKQTRGDRTRDTRQRDESGRGGSRDRGVGGIEMLRSLSNIHFYPLPSSRSFYFGLPYTLRATSATFYLQFHFPPRLPPSRRGSQERLSRLHISCSIPTMPFVRYEAFPFERVVHSRRSNKGRF